MAIKVIDKGKVIYATSSGLITQKEKKKADKLYLELKISLKKLEESLIERGLITPGGVKKDALRVWFEVGRLLNRIGKRYKILGSSEEKYYWRSIYNHVSNLLQKEHFPKRSEDWKVNHFRLCGIMAKRSWNEVKKVGPWSIWRDIFDNKKILEDSRVFDWTVNRISRLRNKGWSHKKIRVFLYAISGRIKDLETSILTNKELYKKLEEIEF